MALGDPILPAIPPQAARVPQATVDARKACAMTLAAYLERVVFSVWPGEFGGSVRQFQLREVQEQWPDPGSDVPYPCASIIDATAVANEAQSFVPQILDDTHNVFHPDTVLWKIAELDHAFQVDFWLNTTPDRQAVAERLPGLFAPGEDRNCVILEGPEAYWCRRVRATLEETQRMDTGPAAYADERRLMATVRCSIDVVELRSARVFAPQSRVSVEVAPRGNISR